VFCRCPLGSRSLLITLYAALVRCRYIVSATIGDPTGTAFVTFFNESAAQLFGLSAAELIALRDTSSAAFDDKFTQILFKVRGQGASCAEMWGGGGVTRECDEV